MRKRVSKILITGGAGFMGSAFARLAIRRGYGVIIVDKLTYAADMKRLQDIEGKFKFFKVDICNKELMEYILKKENPCAIVNFAAETHVDRSIRDARPFIESNILGTQILLDVSKMFQPEKFVHISCYDEKTRALTVDGLKTYKELKRGDKVFSLNPITQEIEIKPIEKVIFQYYRGKMIYFKNKRIDLLVTPNHKMLILNTSKKTKRLLIETAEKASQRSIFYMPERRWIGKEDENLYLKGHGKIKTKDLMYILGIFIGDGFIAYQQKHLDIKTGLPRKEYLANSRDPQSGRFKVIEKMGNHVTTCHSYRIFFDIPENDKSRKKVEQTLANLRIKYHCHKGKAGTRLYFTSKVFMEFFAQCGQKARNKRIPRWALDYAPRYLKHLLDGLMDSDGHSGVIYHTVSEKLAIDICELCIKLNLKPTLRKRHTKGFLKGRKIEGDAYYVFVANTIKSISRHRNKIVNYNGDIWCLKVKNNKNFLVERNGKFDFCGNTDEVYGDIVKGQFTEESPLRPNSPYAASKAAADLLINSYVRTYQFPAIIIRPCNNYGPWQYPEKFIPLSILKVLKGEKIPVYGKGKNVREWLYVSDCAEGILRIMQKGRVGEIYNLGSGEERKNIDTAKAVLKILKKNNDLIEFVKDRPGHDIRYSLNSRKLISEIGHKSKVNLDSGLVRLINWCQGHKEWLFSKYSNIRRFYERRERVHPAGR